ncbi:MAG: squalene--hopene cyclase, partial [Kiritimatiellae bacterium]|nr:squalene--hopene cyclase [Kiritimatiellia bacterium]
MNETQRLKLALLNTEDRLLSEVNASGYWEGELSSSALATAVAVIALGLAARERHEEVIRRGIEWLCSHVNPDGGWGDSPESPSNVSTTLLGWCALAMSGGARDGNRHGVAQTAEQWLQGRLGGVEAERIVRSVCSTYGMDRTFSTPILAVCVLAKRLGPEPEAWEFVPQLPFEVVLIPRPLLRWLQLPVVSYALPALVAFGILRHERFRVGAPFTRLLRDCLKRPALKVLERIQPAGGGFLEAVPLTGFVVMSLAAVGCENHVVVRRGIEFLLSKQRRDGSWPIDTNLATWVTTLAVKALAEGSAVGVCFSKLAVRVREWLLGQQRLKRHPYTGATPGGWGWTDKPGSVPDADDTAGVLLALRRLGPVDST